MNSVRPDPRFVRRRLPPRPVHARAISGALSLTLCSVLVLAASPRAVTAAPPAPRDEKQVYVERIVPLLKTHCLECHGPQKQESDLAFQTYKNVEAIQAARPVWTSVLEMIESEAMPPPDRPRLKSEERRELVRFLERVLFNLDCDAADAIDPGRVTIRRLNRVEYNNTVRDLLGVDFRPADDFPSDDVGHGFDNIGDVLSVSPILVEKYLGAAEKVAASAVAAAKSTGPDKQVRRGKDLESDGAARLTPFGIHSINSRGGVTGRFEAAGRGEYLIRVRAAGQQAGPELPKMELRIDGKEVKTFDVEATADKVGEYEWRQRLDAGAHRISVHFINDYYKPDAPKGEPRDRNLMVGAIELERLGSTRPREAGGARLTIVLPEGGRSTASAAEATLAPVVRRAFRRKPREGEVAVYAKLVERAMERGATYPRGIEVALSAVLVSPHFLFRVEREGTPGDSSARRSLDDFELASRLSYFLWSSMPDDELLQLAEDQKLRDESTLMEQTRRMLADPRSRSLAENFAAQWLNLRGLDELTPDPKQFPQFNGTLRADMRRETELVFDSLLRDERSLLDLLDADFTFVNGRLAELYGLKGVEGTKFQRVSLAGSKRAGILTHASILTLTSNPTRTSPVKRGKWIMENILGTPPPDPPPDAPELAATQKAAPDASLRQALELHRKDPNCAVCHLQMDALGFGFENFDAIGRWRDKDGSHAVDAAGVLPDGAKFSGPEELVSILKGKKTEFTRTAAERMLTYALGRGLVAADRCAVDRIVKQVAEDEFRLSALVQAVVRSAPFRMRRSEEMKP